MIISALAFSLQLTHAQLHSEATLDHRILNEESQGSRCADGFPPTTFFVHGVGYLKYETAPGSFDVPPNSSQIGFEVVNKANDVGTACSFVTAMVNGEYPNTNHLWHDCGNRSLDIDGEETPLRTSARFNWDTWDLAVNQSWMCDEGFVFFLKSRVGTSEHTFC